MSCLFRCLTIRATSLSHKKATWSAHILRYDCNTSSSGTVSSHCKGAFSVSKMLFSTLALVTQALAVTAAKPSLKTRQSGARAWASSSNLSLRLTEIDAPVSGSGSPPPGSGTWDLTIDDTPAGHKQTIRGFGGTVTDATVTVINALPSAQRSQLLRELLTDEGAHFSFLRHTIGASDLSAPPAYTYHDGDGFGLGDRGVAMAELLAEMKGINSDSLVLGSAWSAPGWMKVSRVSHPGEEMSNEEPLNKSNVKGSLATRRYYRGQQSRLSIL